MERSDFRKRGPAYIRWEEDGYFDSGVVSIGRWNFPGWFFIWGIVITFFGTLIWGVTASGVSGDWGWMWVFYGTSIFWAVFGLICGLRPFWDFIRDEFDEANRNR